jgi:hypothetical protein
VGCAASHLTGALFRLEPYNMLSLACYSEFAAYTTRCGCGEIGIRGGLKIRWGFSPLSVRLRPAAPFSILLFLAHNNERSALAMRAALARKNRMNALPLRRVLGSEAADMPVSVVISIQRVAVECGLVVQLDRPAIPILALFRPRNPIRVHRGVIRRFAAKTLVGHGVFVSLLLKDQRLDVGVS